MAFKPRHGIFASLAATILFAALGMTGAYLVFDHLDDLADERIHSFLVLQTGQELLSLLKDAESGQRGFVLTGEEAYLEPYANSQGKVDGQMKELDRITRDPAARQRLEVMKPLVKAKMLELGRSIEERRSHGAAAALAVVNTGEGKRAMDLVRAEMDPFLAIEKGLLPALEAQADADRTRQIVIVVVASLGTLLGAIVFGYLVHREGERLLAIARESSRLQEQAHAALKSNEALLTLTLKSIGDAVMTTDERGCVTLLNPLAERLSGWTLAQAVGHPAGEVLRLVHPATRLPATMPVMEVLAGGVEKGLDHQCLLLARDGSEFRIADSCSPIRDLGGKVVGAVLVFRDVSEARETEDRLAAQSEQQQTILDASPVLIQYKDKENRFLNVNAAMARVNGTSKQALIGKTCWELFSHETADGYWRDDKEVLASGEPKLNILERMETPQGLVYLQSDKIPYRDKDGAVIGVICFSLDVTSRMRTENMLRKADALQDAIFKSANFSCIATDARGVIQIFNVGAERMLGYSADEVMNKVTPADLSDPQELIARAAALSIELGTPVAPGFEALVFKASRGIENICELTHVRKDGSRFPAVVLVTALRDAQDAIIGYLLIGTDNTARKQIEEEQHLLDQRLRDQQFYTRSLLEASIDALMTTDPKGTITDVNKQMELLTDCTRDELIGSPMENYFTDPERAKAGIKRVLTERKVTDYELTARARDGRETVVSYNATTFYDRHRKLQGVFAAAREITELKRFERTLQQKNVELEHATRMKSEFLATMSHELRTPLNAIIGFSEALKDGLIGEMADAQKNYIGDIFSSGQHLLSLINDILDLSKVEAGMMTLELEEVDVPSLLSNSLSIVKEKATAQHIQVGLEAGADLGVPLLDMRKTKQIVYNLLANAVKFTGKGGRVTLRARRVPREAVGTLPGTWPVHRFPLADNDYGEFLEICVSDNGIGISEMNMAKLFQPFSQIDSTLARKYQGTGLGLAMVKIMAELHGGAVAVASAEGEGSSFAAWLPLRVADKAAASLPRVARPAVAADHAPTARIALVVEDDDHAADLIRLLLEAEGFSVLRAASAEAALLLAPQQTLSLITLDIHLPGIDGWEFLHQVRENSALARVPVLVIAGDRYSNMVLNRGAAGVLQKPVSRGQLNAALAHLGLHPSLERPYTVLVVDDDPTAVEVMAAFLPAPAYAVVRAYGGAEAITLARRLQPDLLVLDLMMPEVNGFDVVAALLRDAETARIPILVVTAKQITAEDRVALSGNPDNSIRIVQKAGFDKSGFIAEVRRALLHEKLPSNQA